MTWSPRFPASLCFVACALALVGACSAPKPAPVAPLPEPGLVELLPEGSTLALPRPTPGVARLALWLRAGSRHGTPPALATVSAWWAEQQTGVHARVTPDASEFTLPCDTRSEGLAKCVARINRLFALKAPSPADARALRTRLVASRQRALTDGGRQLELASLRALFGDASRALDPLGTEADDAALTESAIGSFLGAHYTLERAVLMAAGDVTEDVLSKAFASARKGSSRAGAEPAALAAKSGVNVVASDQQGVAATLLAPSPQAASELAVRMRELYPRAIVHAIPLRGMPLVQMRVSATDQPARRMERLVYDLRRVAAELDGTRRHLRPDESLEGLLRELGEGWAARGAVASQRESWALGLATAQLETQPPDSPEAQKRAQQRKQDAERALLRGAELASGRIEGEFDDRSASVRTPGGSRIMVQRRPGDRWFGATIRLAAGSSEDPVTRHGRAALLATLLSEGCGSPWGTRLETTLVALDARIEPLVSADGLGLSVTAPREHARAALDLALRCALEPELTQRALERSRVRLLQQLGRDPGLRWGAHLAQSLAPLAPGVLAPWGTPFGASEVSLAELRRLHAQSLRSAGVSVWVATDVHPEDVARFVARRVSTITRTGEEPAQTELGPVRAFGGELTDVPSARVMIGLRVPTSGQASLAPQVFAEALAAAITKRLGQPLWAHGTHHARGVASGVLFAVTEDELTRLEAALKASLDELRTRPWVTWDKALSALRQERVAEHSSALGWAHAAFFSALHEGDDTGAERAALEALQKASHSLWIMRPRP